jgi:hypothetical protein
MARSRTRIRAPARCGLRGSKGRIQRRGLLDDPTVADMHTWQASGGFSLDASVRIQGTDSAGRERLLRYCARPPFALERLRIERHAGRRGTPGRPARPLPARSSSTQRGPPASVAPSSSCRPSSFSAALSRLTRHAADQPRYRPNWNRHRRLSSQPLLSGLPDPPTGCTFVDPTNLLTCVIRIIE